MTGFGRVPRVKKLATSLVLVALAACHSQPSDPTAGPQSQTPKPLPPPSVAIVADAAPADASVAVVAPTPDEPLGGMSMDKEVQAAFRVAGCGGDDALIPSAIDKKIVDEHCKALKPDFDKYKKEWLEVAVPFIAKIRPKNVPNTVVYPFGGGDLVTTLATYPDATDFTTISLEIAGDLRGIIKPDAQRLTKDLATLRDHLGRLFLKAHSRTINLDIETRGVIPGEVGFTMAALTIHGFEPVAMRYFDFNDDGQIHYFTAEELEKADKAKSAKPFANAEIRFKKAGSTEKPRILRHISFDLSDGNLKKSPGLIKFLDARASSAGGKVSTMTKAASHLLWDDKNFATIRDWLMTHTDWMISDTTGVPPRIAKKNGFVQDVYGLYEWPEPFGTVNNEDAKAFKELYKNSTAISFRYGYPDNASHGHILVTRKESMKP